MKSKLMMSATLMMLVLAATVMAQPPEGGRGGAGGRGGGPGGPGGPGGVERMMKMSPVMAVLDADLRQRGHQLPRAVGGDSRIR